MLQVLGPVSVPVPGTPVRLTAGVTANAEGIINNPERFTCHAVLLQAKPANQGKVYIGWAEMNRTTLAEVSGVLAIPTDNSIPSYSISLTLSPAGVALSELYIDADEANDGVLVTVLVT